MQLNASFGTEATSISLLEGMSLGVPAVVSDFGGNPYVILQGENGIVVPQKNANAICEAVHKLCNNHELYKEMQQKSKKVFQEKFTIEAMTAKTEALYGDLLQ